MNTDWIKKIKAVLFDVDDTLYSQQLSFVRSCEKTFGDTYPIPYDEMFEVYYQTYDKRSNQGLFEKHSMKELHRIRIKLAFEIYGIELTPDQIRSFQENYFWSQQHMRLSPFMEDFLGHCSKRWQLGIISNGNAAYQQRKIASLGLERWIPERHIIISGAVGIEKPAEEIFRIARDRMDKSLGKTVSTQELVFVGDSLYNDVYGAWKAGWHQIWMNRRSRKLSEGQTAPDAEVHTEEELSRLLLESRG